MERPFAMPCVTHIIKVPHSFRLKELGFRLLKLDT